MTTVAPTIPVDAAINAPTRRTDIPSPPLKFPNKLPMECSRSPAILDFSSITPINTNKGTAMSGSFFIIPKILKGNTFSIPELKSPNPSPI